MRKITHSPSLFTSCIVLLLVAQLVLQFASAQQEVNVVPKFSAHNDDRKAFIIRSFCFGVGGSWEIDVKNIRIESSQGAVAEEFLSQRIGLIALRLEGQSYTSGTEARLTQQMGGQGSFECPWDRFKESKKISFKDGADISQVVDIEDGSEGLSVFMFVNCDGAKVSFDMELQALNPGNLHVGIGDKYTSTALFCIAAVLFLSAAFWLAVILRNKDCVFKIHWMMLALVVSKFLSVFADAFRWKTMALYGSGLNWNGIFYTFSFLKGLLFFTVVLLIGTGWSFLKPFLVSRDKKILAFVIPLQVVVNIAFIVISESPRATQGWLTWRDILHIVDILCCCAVLYPIVWSIRALRESCEEDKAQESIQRLKMFRSFYLQVVGFVYFTRIIVFLMRATMPCRLDWVVSAIGELATLLFLLFAGAKFRPRPHNPYFAVASGEFSEETEVEMDQA